jgi:Cys-tRNA(Pro)/Cys-tRNA(Cys) deacylase
MSLKKTNALRLLDSAGVPYRLVEYRYDDENLSVEKIAMENQIPLDKIFKTLVLQGDHHGVLVAVTPGDKALDLKAVARLGGVKKIALVDPKALQSLTGYIRGGCSPVGMKKPFPVFVDESALLHDKILVNAGARGMLMELSPTALELLCGAQFAAIV